jgi:membrane protein YdbS with pleckstrin-like domain
MKNQKFKELTLEQLYTQKKKLQSITIALAILLLIAFCVLLYFVLSTKKFVLIVPAISSFMTLLPTLIILTQINQEIKQRNSQ